MDTNQVNSVINNICDKIGIGINGLKDFVPMLAKYKIIDCIYWIMIGITLLLVGFILFKKALAAYKEADKWHKDGPVVAIAGTCLAMIIGFLATTTSIFNIMQWCVTPEAKTIVYILNMISPK